MMQSENFCAADLWDDANGKYRQAIVKITKVAQGTVVGQKGRKKGMPFVWLEDEGGRAARAPLGLNATNATTVTSVLGTPDAKKWVGGWIGLYVTKVDAPDGMVDAIRIHPKAVQPRTGKGDAPKGDQQPPAADADLSEEDKRAIALAEAEEARRAGR